MERLVASGLQATNLKHPDGGRDPATTGGWRQRQGNCLWPWRAPGVSPDLEQMIEEHQRALKQAATITDTIHCSCPDVDGSCSAITIANPGDSDSFLFTIPLPRITPDQQTELDEPITLSEIQEAIRALATRKTPGLDGLPNTDPELLQSY
ncbi:hypothetical protein NDU88_006781 [Pleurodeles waltl]|uniref:Uncharacterized protein n=1 Tax=Pleurodeles waltl TaxID=8319 RepID=A0AAV7TYR7_PLEWA|nr:hypothetical protein NDU88_006781 [Pleurodeles waltl]